MTPRERIARLEGLLGRVQKNASRPRPLRTGPQAKAPAPAPVAPTPPAPPVVAAPPPPAPAAPVPSPPAPPVEVRPSASSAPPWQPEPGSTVQARPSTIPPEELSEDDLIDVTTIPPEAPAAAAASPNAPSDEIEEPPASSSRSKVAESLDQALATAAAQADEHEVPIHTPPPESGPQEAVLPAIEAPRTPSFGDVARPASLGPTPEQLGETIDLEESPGPEIEIEVSGLAPPEPKPERPVEELELSLPRPELQSGTYDVSHSLPAVSLPVGSGVPTLPATPHEAPEIIARPEVREGEVVRVVTISQKSPENFAELLDGSLAL